VDAVQNNRIEDDKTRHPYGDTEAMTPPAQASPDRPAGDFSDQAPQMAQSLREAVAQHAQQSQQPEQDPYAPLPGTGRPRLRDAISGAQANLAESEQPSGVSRLMTKARGIHNPFLRGLGEVGAGLVRGVDIAGSIAAPNAAAMIPGSTLNRALNVRGAQGRLTQAEANEEKEAQTGRLEDPEHIDTDRGPIQFNRQTRQWEPITLGGNPVGSKSSLESTAAGRRQLSDQYGLSGEDRIRYILTGQMPATSQQPEHMDTDQGPIQLNRQTRQWEPITMGGQRVGPKAQPKPDTPEQQYINADSSGDTATANRLLKESRAWAGATQKPERDPAGGVGSWQLQEDEKGQPVLFNSKTGETKAAPGNLRAKGTFQKTMGPAEDAQNYANDYMAKKQFTGAGDEALMEKYFELAKPSSGFRMTQAQIEMLQKSRDWMGGLAARSKHAFTPEAPWFSDTQRQQIVDTMNLLGQSRQRGGQQGSQPGGGQTKPTPQTHAFSLSAWQKANPKGDVNAAKAAAQAAGYQVAP